VAGELLSEPDERPSIRDGGVPRSDAGASQMTPANQGRFSTFGDRMRVFDLEQPRTEGMPIHPAHRPGYSYLLHRHHEDEYRRDDESGPRSGASGVVICMEHSGTHIDAICHQSDDLKLFGGVRVDASVQTSKGFTHLSVEEIPPILAPGVLLDVAASKGVDELEPGYAVTEKDLSDCSERHGVSIEPGNVVLVRTGNARHWEDPERYLAGPGVAADASRWLAKKQVSAVGADNMAWDVIGLYDAELGCTLPGHLIFLARNGIYIIENLQMEDLAVSGHHYFFFVCMPLKLVGATGSPVRPVAVVSDRSASGSVEAILAGDR
jgi:kynurenine formamidase